MKLYISADIEGISGVSDWDQAGKTGFGYQEARSLMTNEVLAACRGANSAGFSDVVIKDAHGSGKNIIPDQLPDNTLLIRGWSGHPYGMMQEIDDSFDAVAFIGYHGAAGTSVNPLAHSFTRDVSWIKLNEELVSEFSINAMIALSVNVPVVFVSGDKHICNAAKKFNGYIGSNVSSYGIGNSSVCRSPQAVCRDIEKGISTVLHEDFTKFMGQLPSRYKFEVRFNTPYHAYEASFYPGVQLIDDVTVAYETEDFFEMIRAKKFII